MFPHLREVISACLLYFQLTIDEVCRTDIGPDNQLSCLKNVGSPVCAFQITMFFKQHKYIEEMFVYNCVNNDF